MFNAANILEALKNYIHTRGGTSNAYNIAEAVNDLNSIPQGSGGGIPEAPIDNKQYARKNGDWSEVESSGGDIPPEVSNAVETHGIGWTDEEEMSGFDIQWDGNTEGLENIFTLFYKISDDVSEIGASDNIIGATAIINVGGTESSYTINATELETRDGKVFAVVMESGACIFVAFENGVFEFAEEETSFTKGIWFLNVPSPAYVSRLYKEASTQEVVHQIDQKYIPQSSGGGGVVVNCEWNQGTNTVTSSTTFSELMDYLTNGVIPILNVSVTAGGATIPNAIMISSPTYVGLSEEEGPYIFWSATGLTLGCMENTGWAKIVM